MSYCKGLTNDWKKLGQHYLKNDHKIKNKKFYGDHKDDAEYKDVEWGADRLYPARLKDRETSRCIQGFGTYL